VSDTPRLVDQILLSEKNDWTADLYRVGCDLQRELHAANAEIERLTNKVAQLYEGAEEQKQRIKRLEEALRRIANADYRGNRSTESQIAFEALREAKP
jgi:predicted  nucleic acid-binding Zn-ribbon protein